MEALAILFFILIMGFIVTVMAIMIYGFRKDAKDKKQREIDRKREATRQEIKRNREYVRPIPPRPPVYQEHKATPRPAKKQTTKQTTRSTSTHSSNRNNDDTYAYVDTTDYSPSYSSSSNDSCSSSSSSSYDSGSSSSDSGGGGCD